MKTVIISCPVFSRSGYGQHSRLLVDSLLNIPDISLKIVPTQWGTTPQNKYEQYESYILTEQITVDSRPDIWIQVTIPSEFQSVGHYNIGITAGTESSVCSLEFVEGCNKMDKVLTVSEFTRTVLVNTVVEERNGDQIIRTIKVNTPIEVLNIGINPNTFYKKNPTKSSLIDYIDSIPEQFCFIVNGMWTQGSIMEDRKNISGSIRTFMEAFRRKAPKNRPALILKTNGAGFSEVEVEEVRQKIRLIANTFENKNLPNVYLINGDLSDSEMNDLYNHNKVKAMISLAHAEGYNISLAEFSLIGKPIICSMYSGPLDFLNKDFISFIPGKMTKIHPSASNKWLVKDSEWFTPNYNFAIQVMNDMVERYDSYVEKSRKHPKYTKDNFSLNNMTEKLTKIISEIGSKQKTTIRLPKLV